MNTNSLHELKILPEYFAAVISGRKKAEFRSNDRNYQTGDRLLLREWSGALGLYTGRHVEVLVTDVTCLAHLVCGGSHPTPYAMLSIELISSLPEVSGE